MIFNLDYKKKIKCPKLTLKTAGNSTIGLLQLNDKPSFELNANDLSTLQFKIYEKLDNKIVPYYDSVKNGKLISTEKLGVYRIVDAEETRNGKVAYKEVTAKSREYDLKSRQIFDISGVYSLYNVSDTDSSLMHIICATLGNWSISHIDSELTSLYRTFDIDSSDIYSLLTDKIATSFKCVIQFNTYDCTISAYTIENFGKKVNILLSYRNLVQQNIISSNFDDIYTVFRVRGGDDIDIRAVNPTSLNTIFNFDSFMISKSDGGDASDELITAWNTYKTKYITLASTQSTNIATLQGYYAELLDLQTKVPSEVTTDWTQYGLDGLNENKSANILTQSTLLSNGAGSPSSSQYSEYQAIVSTINAISSEIAVREAQISAKNAQITTLQSTISSVAGQLSMSSNFTSDQIKELYSFYREGEYIDETYVVADTDSKETELAVKLQLYNVASDQLVRVSQPQFNMETTLNNLFALPEFSGYQEDFGLGNIIKIKVSNTYIATVRLLSMKIDFNKIEDLSVVFSNRNKLDNSALDLAKITKQASGTSNAVNIGGAGWDKAASKTNEISKYMTNALNAATQEIINSANKDVSIGEYGIRLREKDKDTGLYNPEEAWFVNNKLLFSTDNFASSISGIGKFVSPIDNITYYGFLGEAIVSNIIMGEKLSIINKSGTYSITDETGFLGTATVGANTYAAGLNPSTPNHIIYASINGSDVFNIDTVNNRLSMTGYIKAIGGELKDLTVTGTLTGGYINGSSITVNNGLNTVSINPLTGIELYKGSTKTLYFDADGNIIANNVIFNDGIFKGVLESTTMLSTWTLGNYKNVLEIGSSLFSIDKTDLNDVTQEHAGLYSYGLSLTSYTNSRTADYLNDSIMLHDQYGYLFAVSDVYLSYKGYAIIHSGKNGVTYDDANSIYLFNPASHITMHDDRYQLKGSYASQSELDSVYFGLTQALGRIQSLEDRVSALESA